MKTKLSLSKKVIGLSLGCVLLVSVVNGLQFLSVTKMLDDAREHSVVEGPESISEEVSFHLFERYGDVQAFALHPALKRGQHSEATEILNQYVKLYGIYELLALVRLDGSVVATSKISPKGEAKEWTQFVQSNHKEAAWFSLASKKQWSSDDKTGYAGTVVGQPATFGFLGEAGSSASWAIPFSTLVNDLAGNPSFVLVSFSNLSWMQSAFLSSQTVLQRNAFYGATLSLLDYDGNVLLRSRATDSGEVTFETVQASSASLFDWKAHLVTMRSKESGAIPDVMASDGVSYDLGYARLIGPKANASVPWKFAIRVPSDSVSASLRKLETRFFSFTLVASILGCLIVVLFVRSVVNRIAGSINHINQEIDVNRRGSQQLSQSSEELASASTEQAAAVQESVSAMSEITSMVNESSEGARRSLASAEKVQKSSSDGKEIMDKMKKAMLEIEGSSSNLGEINALIHAIHNKTSVINDIVFKTQLLSFNASIEAARAGQAGKGFSVVAEEVSSLAQMSGSAAKEIESLLSDSQKKVELAIESTTQKVVEGKIITDRAVATFDEISTSLGGIVEKVKGIAEAAAQQAAGIEQTEQALRQVDQATAQNQKTSGEVRQRSQDISNAATNLAKASELLSAEVLGGAQQGDRDKQARASKQSWFKRRSTNNPVRSADATHNVVAMVNPPSSGLTADDPSFKKIAS